MLAPLQILVLLRTLQSNTSWLSYWATLIVLAYFASAWWLIIT